MTPPDHLEIAWFLDDFVRWMEAVDPIKRRNLLAQVQRTRLDRVRVARAYHENLGRLGITTVRELPAGD